MGDVANQKSYLRQAGLQQGAKFVGLNYVANEQWEAMDIELQTADGRTFTERTFGPNIEKVYPKPIWEKGKQVGMETKEQAFKRVEDEIAQKLFYLALCFADRATIIEKVKNCPGLKELVEKVAGVIKDSGKADSVALNFLTIWKNSDSKQRSNLIIAEKVKWVEATQFGPNGELMPAGIKLSNYQVTNCLTEKYPYNSQSAPATPVAQASTSDLPF